LHRGNRLRIQLRDAAIGAIIVTEITDVRLLLLAPI
jgi:hypothetical protein